MKITLNYLVLLITLFLSCSSEERIKDIDGRLLSELIDEKKVELHFFQSSIKMIQVGIEINSWHDIKIKIPAGTQLIPNDDSVQTMVCTQNMEIIPEEDWVKLEIPVACTNLPKKIPYDGTKFRIESKSKNNELNVLFDFINKNNLKLPFELIQSATWIITDNATYYELKGLRTKKDRLDPFGESVISAKMVADGIRLCMDAGIDIRSKEISKYFNYIYDDIDFQERSDYKKLLTN
jgi:hypothetical protein